MSQTVEQQVVLSGGREHAADGGAEATGRNGLVTIARLADDLLPTLITRLSASALGELEVRKGGWRVRLRRRAADSVDSADSRTAEFGGRAPERRPVRLDGMRPAAESVAATQSETATHGEPDRGVVRAPAVGYYLPLADVTVGLSLRGGDLLGHVDVLGVRVDVVVPTDGRYARALAESGEAVEYGQPLARLEAESRA